MSGEHRGTARAVLGGHPKCGCNGSHNGINDVNNLCFRPGPVSPQDRGSVRHLHLASCGTGTTVARTTTRGDGHFVAAIPVRYTPRATIRPTLNETSNRPTCFAWRGDACASRACRRGVQKRGERKRYILKRVSHLGFDARFLVQFL